VQGGGTARVTTASDPQVAASVRAYRGDEPYTFVCWSHDDTTAVQQDLHLLANAGIRVWYDEGISAGRNWRSEIATRLEGATRILYYVSRASLASDHCNREINYALDNGCEVVPVYLEHVTLTPDLRVGLARVHALHRTEDPHYQRHLIEALAPSSATSDRELPAPKPRRSVRTRIAIALIALITVGGVSIALWRQQAAPDHSRSATPAPSIAVLPFANLSGDPQDEYFGDGVAEEILNVLSRVDALRVAARTSAFSFKGKNVEIKEIGQSLGVANVLEGSVRRDRDRVRVNVELIDVASGFRVWGSSFDRKMQDIFAVQDEIAGAVASALQAKLSVDPIPGATTANVDAYNALLKGRALTTYAYSESNRAAIAYLKQATATDSEYGAAYGELALAYALDTVYTPFAELADDWSAAVTRALEINPRDPNALAAKAYYVTLSDWDWATAGALYRQALDVGISSKAALLYGTMYLGPLGKWEEMRSFYNGMLSKDPFNIDMLWDLGIYSTMEGAPKDGLACWNRILDIVPGSPEAWTGKAHAYGALGDLDAARAGLGEVDLERLNPYLRHDYIETLWALGERDEAARLVARFEAEASRGEQYRAALTFIHTSLGDTAKALDGYEAAYAASNLAVLAVLRSPYANAKLRADPRYNALLKKLHLDDESLRASGLL
jgi:TolB-like protein